MVGNEYPSNPNRQWIDVPTVREDIGILVTLLSAPQQGLLRRLTQPGWQPVTCDQVRAAAVINWWADTFWFATPLIRCRDGKAVMAADARPIVRTVLHD
ncbi:hypothetical protein ILP97_17320 [Amycolatopsis sp. H6(2020)]|nr:hypothetical protein [Amycolatopsis sp. H6(2020)]